ncbi:hypothetical protein, partial [Actinoplanes sp. TFC3]|uniref:hypothetical protein n=1 Tax=Actinoplanes sp. TFC3 TaxID=1710355 RepID=UPI0008333ED8
RGCSRQGPRDQCGASAGSRAAGAEAGDAALKGNTDAICDQAARIGGDAAKTFAADLKLLKDAKSADADAAAQVDQKTTRDVQNYAAALADMAKLTTDAKLKKTLAGMGKQISALDGDVRKLNPDKLAGLQEDLSKACS